MSKALRLLHLSAACLWAVLAVPTVLLWKDSVLWVSLMSIYAIVVAHLSAYQATRAEKAASSD